MMASLPTPHGRLLFAPPVPPRPASLPPPIPPRPAGLHMNPPPIPPRPAGLRLALPALPVMPSPARKRSARRRSGRKSVRRTLKLKSSGRFSQYVVRGKGSSRRKVSIKRKACSPQARKVYEGPKGGHYCMKNGRKHYIKI